MAPKAPVSFKLAGASPCPHWACRDLEHRAGLVETKCTLKPASNPEPTHNILTRPTEHGLTVALPVGVWNSDCCHCNRLHASERTWLYTMYSLRISVVWTSDAKMNMKRTVCWTICFSGATVSVCHKANELYYFPSFVREIKQGISGPDFSLCDRVQLLEKDESVLNERNVSRRSPWRRSKRPHCK